MESLAVAALAEIVVGDLEGSGQGLIVSSVSTDSRQVGEGAVFFALRGKRTDGHLHVPEACANGAVAAVVSRDWPAPSELSPPFPLLRVDDPLLALHRLAGWWRGRLKGKVVAVTGTSGKTVVKDALVQALVKRYRAVGSIGSYNSQLGVPLSVLNLPQDAEFAVLEAGVSAPGEMARLEEILRPDYGLLTSLGMTSDYTFDSVEAAAREKLALFGRLPRDGWLLIPNFVGGFQPLISDLPCRILRSGVPSEELPSIAHQRPVADGVLLRVRFPGDRMQEIRVRTSSLELIADLEIAMGAAYLLGLGPEEIAEALSGYEPSHTQTEVWRSPLGVTLISDSGAADLLSVQDALRYLERARRVGGRSVFVFASPAGLTRGEGARLGEMAAQHGVDLLALVSGPEVEVAEAAFRRAAPAAEVLCCGQTAELADLLGPRLQPEDTVLFIGPPSTGVEQVARDITGTMAQTRLIVDVPALTSNIARFRWLVGPRTRIMGMVKALAYGSGLVSIPRDLRQLGLDWLGVSTPDEGMLLRKAGIELPVLAVLCPAEEAAKVVRHRLTPAVHSSDLVGPLAAAARTAGEVLDVHLKVDTGMRRLGVMPEELPDLARKVAETGWLRTTGLMTHFGCADDPAQDDLTRAQLARFREAMAGLREVGHTDLVCHAAATSAAVRFPESHFDMVRIGLGLYGLCPSPAVAEEMTLDLAVALVTRIVEVRIYQRGDRIGYGATYEVTHDGFRAGIIPIGYHDGLPWRLSNQGYVLVNGQRAPIVGRVSMDSAVLDLSEIPDSQVGSEVLIYGKHGGYVLRPEEVAARSDTIVYELLTRIGPRVQRVFVG